MRSEKTISWFLIIGAIGVLVPYTILTITFDYPDILRKETGEILTRFNEGGSKLVWTWFIFGLGGITLIPAYILIGQKLESKSSIARTATMIGVIGLVVQMIGLLRWTFVVPVLASSFVQSTDEATKAASVISFKTIHQYGGVLLGEHLGQLFTIIWTVLISVVLDRLKLMPKWVTWLAYISSAIYLLSQAELLSTVMPGIPVWDMAGFIGSTLWLIWLVIVGIRFLKIRLE
ncbi:MAG TPA: DUF4386 domain-containing protein [Chitinophagaceae bacterium]|nr:DUF4386 domain-containing protein [Chitinophagaceae bacterium]